MNYTGLIRRSDLGQRYTPEELLEVFQNYVVYMANDGLIWVHERVTYKGNSELYAIPRRAPLTPKGFCVYARISESTFRTYLDPNSTYYVDYHEVAEYIVNSCQVDFVNGAAVGIFNGNMAIQFERAGQRMLGENTDEEGRGRGINAIEHRVHFLNYSSVTDVELQDTQVVPSDLEEPLDVDLLIAQAEKLQGDKAKRELSTGDYDNKESTSSRNDTMIEYVRRNGIGEEEE